jgi:hypothetical protein
MTTAERNSVFYVHICPLYCTVNNRLLPGIVLYIGAIDFRQNFHFFPLDVWQKCKNVVPNLSARCQALSVITSVFVR